MTTSVKVHICVGRVLDFVNNHQFQFFSISKSENHPFQVFESIRIIICGSLCDFFKFFENGYMYNCAFHVLKYMVVNLKNRPDTL
jgi:hypothetical protein